MVDRRVSTSPEVDVENEIDSLMQNKDKTLAVYYQRTVSLLRRTRSRDKPRNKTITPLSGLGAVMLNCLANAFVNGLNDGTTPTSHP